MNDFNIGDIVSLKSNPKVKMTVKEKSNNKIVSTWLDSNGIPQEKEFDIKLLQKFDNNVVISVLKHLINKRNKI